MSLLIRFRNPALAWVPPAPPPARGHLRSIAKALLWRNSFDSVFACRVPNHKSYQIKGMLEVARCMRYIDLAVIVTYLLAITWFGTRFRSGQKNLRDYFLGGRSAPWWAISLSIVSAE